MKSLALASASTLAGLLAISITAPGSARADGYVAVGVGTAADTGGSGGFSGDDGLSGRLMLGQRISLLSIEAGVSGYGVEGMSPGADYDAIALGAGLKLNLPIVLGLEIFGRAGIERTWLEAEDGDMNDFSGNGYVAGAGVEYMIPLGVTDASLWLDWTRHGADLHDDEGTERDATADLWTAGLSIHL
jgi:hypothetical protein